MRVGTSSAARPWVRRTRETLRGRDCSRCLVLRTLADPRIGGFQMGNSAAVTCVLHFEDNEQRGDDYHRCDNGPDDGHDIPLVLRLTVRSVTLATHFLRRRNCRLKPRLCATLVPASRLMRVKVGVEEVLLAHC